MSLLARSNRVSQSSVDSVSVRPWTNFDIESIRALASSHPTFSVPSRYLLDVLQNGDPDFNLIATTRGGETLGYILAFRSHPNELFVWQLASTQHSQTIKHLRGAGMSLLLAEFASAVRKSKTHSIQFSMASKVGVRWMTRLARDFFGVDLRDLHFKIDGEDAYEIRLGEVPVGLGDVYQIPDFPKFVRQVFTSDIICPEWLHALNFLNAGETALELGAGDGRLTSHLLSTGAQVVAVEPNVTFDPRLGRSSAHTESLRILRGYFPNIPSQKISCIVLYQNVFLEIANQMDEGELLSALRSFLLPGGRLLFDYVSDLVPGPAGSVISLFHGPVPDIGDVHYEGEYVGKHWGLRHEALMKFSVNRNGRRQTYTRRIEFRLPGLGRVRSEIGQLGGSTSVQPINMFTFFPGQAHLVCASFAH